MLKDFIEFFKLTPWDWFSALVAFLSFVVAVSAFVIAIRTYSVSKKTLASQKQTEKNTTPPINLEIQIMLIKVIISDLYESFLNVVAIKNVLKSDNYQHILPGNIWENLCLREDYIHGELFYDNDLLFGDTISFARMIKEYNTNISALKEYINLKMEKKVIERIFKIVEHQTSSITLKYVSLLSLYDVDAKTIIDHGLRTEFNILIRNEHKVIDDKTVPKYIDHNPFSFFSTKENEQYVINYMNDEIKERIYFYSKYLFS